MCSTVGCEKAICVKGPRLCWACYMRGRRAGTILARPRKTPAEAAERKRLKRNEWEASLPAERKRARRIRKYGLQLEAWQAMWDSQKGLCAACSEKMLPSGSSADSVVVDHCHATGAVRALLHSGCNKALGHLQENPSRAAGLASYVLLRCKP